MENNKLINYIIADRKDLKSKTIYNDIINLGDKIAIGMFCNKIQNNKKSRFDVSLNITIKWFKPSEKARIHKEYDFIEFRNDIPYYMQK